jgi:hypothetical protein
MEIPAAESRAAGFKTAGKSLVVCIFGSKPLKMVGDVGIEPTTS